jgi:hypothetical protein
MVVHERSQGRSHGFGRKMLARGGHPRCPNATGLRHRPLANSNQKIHVACIWKSQNATWQVRASAAVPRPYRRQSAPFLNIRSGQPGRHIATPAISVQFAMRSAQTEGRDWPTNRTHSSTSRSRRRPLPPPPDTVWTLGHWWASRVRSAMI